MVNKSKMPLTTLDSDSSPKDLPERYEVKIIAPVVPTRIVHLDLKGAAPKVKYLEQVRKAVLSDGKLDQLGFT